MQKKFLGDSYDIVKRSVLQALDDSSGWAVHPMLTHGSEGEDFTLEDIGGL